MIQTTLQNAYLWRQNLGLLRANGETMTQALRIFYGPGESEHLDLKNIAIDLFDTHAWLTAWTKIHTRTQDEIVTFLKSLKLPSLRKIESAVFMDRSEIGSNTETTLLYGTPPESRFPVKEFGIPYSIQLTNTKHPGLFLDHAPLRYWLKQSCNQKAVLNLFAYTGSLSSAAGKGGASRVTTIDLSKATIEWAEENWKLAGLPPEKGMFIYGDVFEWLPRLKKKNDTYDLILCDPPSFSRSKNGVFSTTKDLPRLHELIFPLLNPGGILVTSINSENHTETRFLSEIHSTAEKLKIKLKVLKRIDLPESFPTRSEQLSERYLKGFYLIRE